MTIIEDLAAFASRITLADLPDEVVYAAKRATVDTLGVAVIGSIDPAATTAARAYGAYIGSGPSLALGSGGTLPEVAALLNGIAAHSPEMDDFHRAATVHAGAVVIPAALAAGQEHGVSGARLLESIIAGYEVAIRLGLATRGTLYGPGFHPTGAIGVFGAAAAAARVAGLDPDATAHAIGLAGTRASGLLAYKMRGDWSKRLQAGTAASQGLGAARLAGAGYLGPLEVFEGQYGFLGAYSRGGYQPEEAISGLGERFHIGDVSFKPYASCRFTHAPIDALMAAMLEGNVQPQEVRRIEVAVHAQAIASTMVPADRKYKPQTPVDAQFSLPYCLAVAMDRRGHVPPDAFGADVLSDPGILEAASLVEAVEDPAYTALFPARNAARVTVHTDRGTFSEEVPDARGDPESPLSDKALEAKFVTLVRAALGGEAAAYALAGSLWSLEQHRSLEAVVGALEGWQQS